MLRSHWLAIMVHFPCAVFRLLTATCACFNGNQSEGGSRGTIDKKDREKKKRGRKKKKKEKEKEKRPPPPPPPEKTPKTAQHFSSRLF